MVIADVTPLWLAWNVSPTLVLGLGLLVGGYLYAIGPLASGRGWPERATSRQIVFFLVGAAVLVVALMSPLDTLGDDYLFSAHMVQHMLLAIVAPPLLLLGVPAWLWERVLSGRRARWVVHGLAYPPLAFGLLNADLWLWHAPALFDATLANETLHVFEHLTFIVFGLIFWLPILGPPGIVQRIGKGTGVLYLFLACQPMVALGALLTFAAHPFYAPYVHAPRLWGTTALGDQQLGGLIMWMPTNIPYLIGLSVLFFQWVGDHDQAEHGTSTFDDDEPYELFPSSPPATLAKPGSDSAVFTPDN